jgi:hypothetical protein
MTKLETLLKKLRSISEAKQTSELLKMIREDEPWVVDLNRVQLLEGKDSNDSYLKKYRSKSYAKYKETLNPLGVTDLKLTGKFHNSFVLKARSFPITITATDKKKNDLVKKYGKAIFGLNQESRSLLVERLKSKVTKYYRRLINL